MVKKKALKTKKNPVKQRKFDVGYKKPPQEQQFKPWQSGNPKGPLIGLNYPKSVVFCEPISKPFDEVAIPHAKKE